MSYPGFATLEGTSRYRDRFSSLCAKDHFREIGEVWLSSIGVGTYLGKPDDPTDEAVARAIVQSVQNGVNVLDTAINYRRERGEKSVGQALERLIGSGEIHRDEILVCTKGGFLPQSLGAQWYAKQFGKGGGGIGMDDLVAGCHCMHPEYLSNQLECSLKNLGLKTIDLYYIHNPETQLGKVDDHTFYERLALAFEFLESAVEEGKIKNYGLATWKAFRLPEENGQSISLAQAKNLARQSAGGENDHFRFIQMPLSLPMPEVVLMPTQRVGDRLLPAIEAAAELNMFPIASASIGQGQALSLAEKLKPRLGAVLTHSAQRALQFTRSAPGLATALIGMKQPNHVKQNLELCKKPLLEPERFQALLKK